MVVRLVGPCRAGRESARNRKWREQTHRMAGRQSRALPSAWTTPDTAGRMQEAQEALETYRKKDPNKGAYSTNLHARGVLLKSPRCSSRRAVQGGRKCTDNEAELLQDHRDKSIPGCDSVLEERARVEGWRPSGEHRAGMLVFQASLTLCSSRTSIWRSLLRQMIPFQISLKCVVSRGRGLRSL